MTYIFHSILAVLLISITTSNGICYRDWKIGCVCSHYTSFDLIPSCQNLSIIETNIEAFTVQSLNIQEKATKYIVKILHLNETNIIEIENDAFSRFGNLEKLYLRGNKLSNIDDKTFQYIDILKLLDISKNQIATINNFTNLTYLEELHLEENNITTLLKKVFPLKLIFLNFSHNQLSEIDTHLAELYKLKFLDLSHNAINFLKVENLKNLISLVSLDISHNYIHLIKTNSFNNLIPLQTINLSHNKIVEIERDAFISLPFLNTLKLDNNKIRLIDANWLHDVGLIESIYLNHNHLKELKSYTFPPTLDNLVLINLSNNNINELEDNVFARSLKILNLAVNELTSAESGVFANLSKLEKLDLNNNKLNVINGDFFQNVKFLNVSNNELIEVSGTFQNLTNIDLSHNTFKNIDFIKNIKKIEYLNLSDNYIENLKKNIFDGSITLKEVILKNNLIKEIPQACFTKLKLLQKLDFSLNSLTEFNIGNTVGLCALQTLVLSSNDIRHFTKFIDLNMIQLRTLDLRKNQLEELDFVRERSVLENVYISGNKIKCSKIRNILQNMNDIIVYGDDEDGTSIKGIACEDDEFLAEADILNNSNGNREKLLEVLNIKLEKLNSKLEIIIGIFVFTAILLFISGTISIIFYALKQRKKY